MSHVCMRTGHALAARTCRDSKSALLPRPHARCIGLAASHRSEGGATEHPLDHRQSNRIFPVASTSAAAPQRRAQRLHAFAEDAGPDSGDILDRDGDWDADADMDAAGDEYADAEGEEDLEDAEDPDEMDFDEARAEYMEYCRERFSIPQLVDVVEGINNLPCIQLHHPNGSEVEIYLHGANVVSWRKADSTELLYVRPENTFDGIAPIQGGIPLIFPQYGRGVMPSNGFMRDLHWSIADTSRSPDWAEDAAPSVALWAEHTEETASIWPHRFEAMYTVTLMEADDEEDYSVPNPVEAPLMTEDEVRQESYREESEGGPDDPEPEDHPIQLRCVLEISNTDDKPFTFQTALQSHFAVHDLETHGLHVRTLGLGGKEILDFSHDAMHPILGSESEDYLTFGEDVVDRLYVDAAGKGSDVMLCPGDRTYTQIYNRQGFKDIGAYNPHLRLQEIYRHFVALPSARVARPVTLQPGESWVGEMAIRAHDVYWPMPIFGEGRQPLPPALPRSKRSAAAF